MPTRIPNKDNPVLPPALADDNKLRQPSLSASLREVVDVLVGVFLQVLTFRFLDCSDSTQPIIVPRAAAIGCPVHGIILKGTTLAARYGG
jgi:hypothetical protein